MFLVPDDGLSRTSLAQYRQSRTDQTQLYTPCPSRAGLFMLNIDTGQRVPAGCDRLSCPVCVRRIAIRYGQAIGLARPERGLLLTQVGDDWPTIQSRVHHLRKTLRRRGLESHEVFHVEPNPLGSGHHIHAWQWGDPLNDALLSDAAASAGMGTFAVVRPRRAPDGAPLAYGLKVVIDGSPDGRTLPENTWQFLRLNGGRLGHATRSFWRDEHGRQLSGVREAYRAVARLRGGQGDWVLTAENR
jgi:hypothetical protein